MKLISQIQLSVPVVVLFLAAAARVSAATTADFDSAGTPITLVKKNLGSAPQVLTGGPSGSFARLTDSLADETNMLFIDRSDIGPANTVTIDFDYRTGAATSGLPGDGFGFFLLNTTTFGTTGDPGLAGAEEAGAFNSLGIGFDIYNNNTPEDQNNANHISVRYNDIFITQKNLTDLSYNLYKPVMTASTPFDHAQIVANLSAGTVSVFITPAGGATLPVFSNLTVPGLAAYEWRLAFGGRTGGANTTTDIDNVTTGAQLTPPIITPGSSAIIDTILVTISAGFPIHYTLNNTAPTANSPLYTSAIPISSTTTLRAVAVNGSTLSAEATATYTGQDTNAPSISVASPGTNQLTVTFSEAITNASAAAGNFSVNGGIGTASTATLSADLKTVTLTFATAFTSGNTYVLTASNISDLATPANTAASLTKSFNVLANLSGQIAWLKLDETSGALASDSAGSGNNGTLAGAQGWGPGIVNGGFNFNGAANISCPTTISTSTTGGITVAAWFKTSTTTGNFRAIDCDGHFNALKQLDGTRIEVGYWNPDYHYGTTNNWRWGDGKWHHLAATYDPAVGPVLYMDGVVEPLNFPGGAPVLGPLSSNPQFFNLGARSPALEDPYTGALDDVRVFNRALSVSEVQTLISAASVQFVWDAGGDGTHWSSANNWDVNSVPASQTQTSLLFPSTGPNPISANNDIAGTFTLNSMSLSSSAPFNTISGNPLAFVSSGSPPTLNQLGTGIFAIANNLTLSADLTLAGGGSGLVNLDGVISGSSGIVKTGTGTVILTAANTYTGATTVQAGSLNVAGSTLSATTVASGATLSGTGSVGAVTVAGGGAVSPGAPGVGTLTTTALTLSDTSILNFVLSAQGNTIQVNGNLTLDGVINLNVPGALGSGRYVLIHYTGTLTNNGAAIGSAPPQYSFQLDTSVGGEVSVLLRPNVTINQAGGQADPATTLPIVFAVVFDSVVTGFTGSDVIISGTATGATAAVVDGGNGKNYTVNITGLTSDGTVTVSIPVDAARDATQVGNAASTSTDNSVVYDAGGAPTVTDVTSSTANGTYGQGQVILITVTFSEAVTVTGVPQLALQAGITPVATYTSGSGTKILTFSYTVAIGDASSDLSYGGTNSLSLNGGSIKDGAQNNAVLALPATNAVNSLATQKDIVIDTKPALSTIVPNTGAAAGGTSVTITGGNLNGATVTFGGTPGLNPVTTATSIIVATPPHALGAVDVVVTNGGQSATLANGFTYADPPTIGTITPSIGKADGGETVSITGTNFVQGMSVKFGGTASPSVTVGSATSLSCVTPAHARGAVDVVLTTGAGDSAPKVGGFTFNAKPELQSPPTVVPTPPIAGRPITVTVNVTDPDNDTLTVSYNWGDSTDTLNTHTYANAGSYTLIVTHTDLVNNVLTTIVPIEVSAAPTPMTVTKFAASFKFGFFNKDKVQVSGSLGNTFPAIIPLDGLPIHVDVGGAVANFTLNEKAKVKNLTGGSFSLKLKLTKNKATKKFEFLGGPIGFQTTYTGTFINAWADEGVNIAQSPVKAPHDMIVDLVFNQTTYTATMHLLLTAKMQKSGKFVINKDFVP